MEKLCGRVRPEDGPALERLVQPIRDRASAAAQDFLLLHSNPAPLPQAPRHPGNSSSGGSQGDDVGREPPPVNQTQLLLPVIPLNESAAESWDTLEEVGIFVALVLYSQIVLIIDEEIIIFIHVFNMSYSWFLFVCYCCCVKMSLFCQDLKELSGLVTEFSLLVHVSMLCTVHSESIPLDFFHILLH
uniref:Uncharacterized protein n=1 Tax=Hucho hucho TaxID=62062 RepID=A0A4W5PJP9_9TELE